MPISAALLRVVLDTNVWISGIFFGRGAPAQLLRQWRDGRFEVVVSSATLDELARILQSKAIQFGAPELSTEWHELVQTYAVHVAVDTLFGGFSRDPNDDMLLEAAVAGQVNYLVTGDKDLLVLGQIESTPIITPREFLELLKTKL